MVDISKTPYRTIGLRPGQTQQSRVRSTRLVDCIQKVIVALRFYGFDDCNYSTAHTLRHWTLLCTESGGFMPFMKYKLAAFYAACQGEYLDDPQEIPAAPFTSPDVPHILLGGRAYKFVRYLSRQDKCVFHEFLVTILQIKKGLERPDEELLIKGSRDTFNTLTTAITIPKPIYLLDWSDIPDTGIRNTKSILTNELMHEEIKRTVKEIFIDSSFTDVERYAPFFPSTSANYIRSRSGGGAVGEIMKDYELMEGLKYVGTKVNIFGSDEDGFTIDSDSLDHLYSNWKILYERMFSKAITEIPYAEPVALAEALKVRVITKGPPMLNTVLKPLQKFLWSKMKVQPTFELIGKWVSTEFLAKRLGSVLSDTNFGFLSVDYKDATNKLRGDLSEVCANEISRCISLSEDERMLFIRALTGHMIVNPDDPEQSKPQLNGQLMGSIISFPILCIINAAILRLVREIDCNRKFTLKDSNIIVNGDDGLLKSSRLGMEVWKKIGQFCGLAPSVGKVYYSRKFFNINSTTYEYTHGVLQDEVSYDKLISHVEVVEHSSAFYFESNGSPFDPAVHKVVRREDMPVQKVRVTKNKTLKVYFKLVKYINFGLLYDLSRSSNDSTNSTLSVTSIGERANELLRTCPDHLKEKVLTFYMGKHIELLKSLNLPWYIPEHLGGLGITPLPNTRHQPSQLALRVAAKAHRCGVKFPKLRPTDVWQTWKLAVKALPADQFSSEDIISGSVKALSVIGRKEEENLLNNEKVWSLQNVRTILVVETLFNQYLSTLVSQLVLNKHTIEMNYYRKLARANKIVSRNTFFPGFPLSSIQPFSVGQFPGPPVDVDNVPFIYSNHPMYSVVDAMTDAWLERVDGEGEVIVM